MTSKLSTANFAKAQQFIKTQARPLEQALFAYHFEDGSQEAVLTALAAYQNDDSGFGHALEPDTRLAASSPLATTVALQTIRALDVAGDHPLLQKAIAYLLGSYNEEKGYWQPMPQAVNAVPHAPWWHYDEETDKTAPETPANPTAEIVGYFHLYPAAVPANFLARITEAVIQHLETNHEAMAMFDLHCYRRLVDTVPTEQNQRVMAALKPAVLRVVEQDPAAWEGYVATPLEFVKSPASPFYEPLREAVAANLDRVIQAQNADGSWRPKWTWGGTYPDDWALAEREWAGIITLETLETLHAFGRISEDD